MTAHGYAHPMCRICWNQRRPNDQPPRTIDPDEDWCCFCGRKTTDGIYVRAKATHETTPQCTDLEMA